MVSKRRLEEAVLGATLLLAGVVGLLDKLNLLVIRVNMQLSGDWARWWPLAFVAAGVAWLAASERAAAQQGWCKTLNLSRRSR